MKAIKTEGPGDKKKKRKARRAARKNNGSSSTPVFATSNDGVKGSCEDGNLRSCKTKSSVTPKFNPKKKRLKGRTVGSAAQREREEKKAARKKSREAKNKNTPYSSPRFL
jgi:hypothetical protein